MEKSLQIIELTAQADEAEIDPQKLKFFNSILKVWDFAKISSSEFQSLSFDDKSRLLKNYYLEISSKYTEGRGKQFFCCFLAIFWLYFDWILALFWVKFWGGAFWFFGEPSSIFKKANLFSMSKATTGNDKNVNMRILTKMKLVLKRFWLKGFGESMGSSIHESLITEWRKWIIQRTLYCILIKTI